MGAGVVTRAARALVVLAFFATGCPDQWEPPILKPGPGNPPVEQPPDPLGEGFRTTGPGTQRSSALVNEGTMSAVKVTEQRGRRYRTKSSFRVKRTVVP